MPMDGRKMSWNRRMIKIDRTDRLQRIRCTAKTWGDALLKLVYPPRCAVCDRLLEPVEIRKLYGDTAYGLSWKEYVHPQCAGELNWVWNPVCMHCGRPLTEETAEYCFDCARKAARIQSPFWNGTPASYIAQGKAVFSYRGEIKRTMYRFKYGNRREYARFLALAALERWGEWLAKCEIEAVIPVPMYRRKERKRGYNQAALLAKTLADIMKLDYVPDMVHRVVNTRPQKELSDVGRENNLKNAFQVSDNIVQYKHVLLVDDIYTTGSTAEAVAEELCKAGVGKVHFLAACIAKGF